MFLPRLGVSKSKKRFVALARVSSREQEREGFSLDVQVDALRLYAERNNGEIIRFFRIAETASKHDERKTFKELLAYRNIRINGRSIVEINPKGATVVRRAFELYAHHNHTLDTLGDALVAEGVFYCPSMPKFPRSKLHTLLTDRAYIGEIRHQGQWLPGTHEPIVDRAT